MRDSAEPAQANPAITLASLLNFTLVCMAEQLVRRRDERLWSDGIGEWDLKLVNADIAIFNEAHPGVLDEYYMTYGDWRPGL